MARSASTTVAATLLVVLASLSMYKLAAASLAPDLCYQVAWGVGSTYRKYVIRPVTAFPAEHALVARGYCGGKNTGDPIPHDALWSTRGRTNPWHCQQVSGAEAFYAYNKPYSSSSNTGFEQQDTDLLYFVVDDEGEVSFVAVHDLADDGSGGQVNIELSTPDLIGEGVTLEVRDDPGKLDDRPTCEASTSTSDCYTWDQDTMSGYFNQIWASCCTDGFVLSKLPLFNWRFNFKYDVVDEIYYFKVGNFNPDTNQMDFLELDAEEVLATGVEVSAFTCNDYCASKSCGECTLDPQCGWCDTQGCLARTNEDTCTGSWLQDACCPSCSVHTECQDCMNAEGCGWSYSLGQCLSGTTELGLCQSSEFYQIPRAGNTVCRALPGPVISPDTEAAVPSEFNSPVLDWCSGHGDYVWGVSTTCDCHEGWAGNDCSIECPRGPGGQICDGHGTCDRSGGFCLCECGYGGPDGDCSQQNDCDCELVDNVNTCFINEEANCPVKCGVVADNVCTGIDVDFHSQGTDRRVDGSECVCAEGWWGAACDQACPGIDPSTGEGEACDGNGICDVTTGSCECAPCYEVDGTGQCVPKACPSCGDGGRCECDEDSGEQVCRCPGQRYGDICELCACEHGSCNSLSGNCDCDEGWSGELCNFQCSRESKCHGHGECNDETGQCDCDENYIGNTDNQCKFLCPPKKCGDHGFCDGEDGSCVCQTGYFGEPCTAACDLDMCQNGATCTMDASAANGYVCECPSGFTGTNCQNDKNECSSASTNSCDSDHGICSNTDGSYTCSCEAGWALDQDGFGCSDVNECLDADANECDSIVGSCTNTIGSYTCSCDSGYALGEDGHTCSDVDECSEDDLNECNSAVGSCSNTAGSYTCSCGDGYELAEDGHTCLDVNECLDASLNECDASVGECTNTDGSYTCSCREGFELQDDGISCEDVDECSDDELNTCTGANMVCSNTVGSFECVCGSGFEMAQGGTECEDVDECAGDTNPCDGQVGECSNTDGSYTCSCPDGYELANDGVTCEDVNECTSGTHQCSHYCKNTPGSYTCRCPAGFVLDASELNCFFFFSTPARETTTTSTTASTTTSTAAGAGGSTTTAAAAATRTTTTTSRADTTTPAASSTSAETTGAEPMQVVLTESLRYANLNCTPEQEHLDLAEQAGVREVVIDAFAGVAEADSVVPVLFLESSSGSLVLQYVVTVAEADAVAAEAITHEVAQDVTAIMTSIEESDSTRCVFFNGVDFTRESDRDVVPTDSSNSSASVPIAGIAGGIAALVLAVVVVAAVVSRKKESYGFELGKATGAASDDFANPMYSTKERNLGFDNPIYDDVAENDENDDDNDRAPFEKQGSLVWDTY